MIFQKRHALHAESECEAGILVGVDIAAGKHVGMYHAGAEYLDPALALTEAAALASAGEAGHIDLSRRLGEGEVVGTEADLGFLAEHLFREHGEGAFEVRHGDVLIDNQSLDLVEEGRMGGVDRVGAVYPSGGEDADRRALFLHHAHLHGGGCRRCPGYRARGGRRGY